jgi:hypothetical protein
MHTELHSRMKVYRRTVANRFSVQLPSDETDARWDPQITTTVVCSMVIDFGGCL